MDRLCEVCHLGIEGGRLIAFLDADGWHVLHGECFQSRTAAAGSAPGAGVSSVLEPREPRERRERAT